MQTFPVLIPSESGSLLDLRRRSTLGRYEASVPR